MTSQFQLGFTLESIFTVSLYGFLWMPLMMSPHHFNASLMALPQVCWCHTLNYICTFSLQGFFLIPFMMSPCLLTAFFMGFVCLSLTWLKFTDAAISLHDQQCWASLPRELVHGIYWMQWQSSHSMLWLDPSSMTLVHSPPMQTSKSLLLLLPAGTRSPL